MALALPASAACFVWLGVGLRIEGRGRVSARRPTCFLLLRQKKVGKEKATPLAVSLRFTAASQSTKRGHPSVPTRASPAALLGTSRGDQSPTRAIAALGLDS